MADDSQFERLRFHSLLLFLEGLLAILFIFVDSSREGSRLPITALFPLVLYTYGLHGALSTAVLMYVKHFKTNWYWVLLLHVVSVVLMAGVSVVVFSVFVRVLPALNH